MPRHPGVFVEPIYGRLIKLYCSETGVTQTALADEIGLSYPTLSRGINGHRVDRGSRKIIEGLAKRIAIEHPDMMERADEGVDFSKPMHIVASRLADKFGLTKEEAKRVAQSVLRGLRIFA